MAQKKAKRREARREAHKRKVMLHRKIVGVKKELRGKTYGKQPLESKKTSNLWWKKNHE